MAEVLPLPKSQEYIALEEAPVVLLVKSTANGAQPPVLSIENSAVSWAIVLEQYRKMKTMHENIGLQKRWTNSGIINN